MRKKINIQKGAVLGAILTTIVAGMLLSVVQVVVKPPLLLGERLLPGGGWIQIVLAALFGGWLYLQMFDRKRRGMWRRRIWLLFSIVFFSQLFLGIFVDSMFLMSGKLHFPIPGLIPAGVFYRGEVSFMPFLFLVTILLSGGAWCSQLCYFGAWDSLAAGKNGKREALSSKMRTRMRWTVLFVFIGVASALRGFGIPVIYSTGIAAFAGIVGIMIILLSGGDFGYVFETSVSVAIASERSLSTLHGLYAGVSVRGSVESRRAERASGNQLYFVWRLSCGVRS